jgi:integrase
MAGRRPGPEVVLWAMQDRSNTAVPKPFVVRWRVGTRKFSRAFSLKTTAADFEARLRVAAADGERFDAATGEPLAWADSTHTVASWTVEYVKSMWPDWRPNSRRSAVEGLERAIPLLVSGRAPQPPPNIRKYLRDRVLRPVPVGTDDEACEKWLARWSLPLHELTPAIGASVWDALADKNDGTRGSANTANRYRNALNGCLSEAVERELLDRNPLPSSRARKKKTAKQKPSARVKLELLPSPMQMRSILAAVENQQPRSRLYKTFLEVVYLAGCRPSEVAQLEPADCTLPDTGWGSLRVRDARSHAAAAWVDNEAERVSGPKGQADTHPGRRVPIPPELVASLRDAIERYEPTGLIFTTRTGAPLKPSNLNRAWTRAKLSVLVPGHPLLRARPYDLRHAQATLQLRAGVAVPVIAKRLGHSPEILLSIYAGVLPDDDAIANERITIALAG